MEITALRISSQKSVRGGRFTYINSWLLQGGMSSCAEVWMPCVLKLFDAIQQAGGKLIWKEYTHSMTQFLGSWRTLARVSQLTEFSFDTIVHCHHPSEVIYHFWVPDTIAIIRSLALLSSTTWNFNCSSLDYIFSKVERAWLSGGHCVGHFQAWLQPPLDALCRRCCYHWS